MNKKGFTLIEIIVVLVLISVIGTSSIILSTKTKEKNEINELRNKVLEAANVYINVEKDETGKIYQNEIVSGRKGVKIPITNLVDKGYVTKEETKKLYELEKLNESDNYYVLVVNGGTDEKNDYCETGEISTSLSWTLDSDKPIYLCEKTSTSTIPGDNASSGGEDIDGDGDGTINNWVPFIYHVLGVGDYWRDSTNDKVIEKSIVSDADLMEFCTMDELEQGARLCLYNNIYNGLFKRSVGSGEYYYFLGNVSNNYVKIGNTLFRMVYFYRGINWDESYLKLITENAIEQSYFKNSDGEYDAKLDFAIKTWLDTLSLKDNSIFVHKNDSLRNGYGLLSLEEAKFAGALFENDLYNSYATTPFKSTQGKKEIYDDTFLSTGSSTILSANGTYKYYLNNVFSTDGTFFQTRGVIAKYDSDDSKVTDTIIANMIRPVITIEYYDLCHKGTGTKTDPYILKSGCEPQENPEWFPW